MNHAYKKIPTKSCYYSLNNTAHFLAILCITIACQEAKTNHSGVKAMEVTGESGDQHRNINAETLPGFAYYYQYLQCNKTKEIEPTRKIVTKNKITDISRSELFAKNNLSKHYQFLDCILWFHDDPEELIFSQRYCGIKYLCNVRLENQEHCKNHLNDAIEQIKTKKDINTAYLNDSPEDLNDTDHPVQKVCSSLFPKSLKAKQQDAY
ncbi:MAG: hypothetical protein OXC44_02615 [Proteobacteria bacterium]|nr:hypothetical protein [Pseudomonadota bacterium]